jgi:hypothetical protein
MSEQERISDLRAAYDLKTAALQDKNYPSGFLFCEVCRLDRENYELRNTLETTVSVELGKVWSQLHDIERGVLLEIAERVLAGQRRYGPFEDTEKRDLTQETMQELMDSLVYTARLTLSVKK